MQALHRLKSSSLFRLLRRYAEIRFDAKIPKLLDLVTHSIYSSREIFLRELISNSSDALKKGSELKSVNNPSEIRIFADISSLTLSIQDTGIGMTREELVKNLGTIAHSASQESHNDGVIGRFGIGFYSAFSVARCVDVYSQSPNDFGYRWSSRGHESYSITRVDGLERGTTVVLHLKEEFAKFADDTTIAELIIKHSGYISFPIYLNGVCVTDDMALWMKAVNDVSDVQHQQLYQTLSHSSETPRERLHIHMSSPLTVHGIVYVPQHHTERFGMPRMEPGVQLYCRRVLVQEHPRSLLPLWLRFLKGVVDCPDIPLNVSRESIQENGDVTRLLNRSLTNHIVEWLRQLAKTRPEDYVAFFREYSTFLKEGIWLDPSNQAELIPLLRYETYRSGSGRLISLQDYVDNMPASQSEIYYICSPTREAALSSPYLEAIRSLDYDVIFGLHPADEIVMQAIETFAGKPIRSADTATLAVTSNNEGLSNSQARELCEWCENILSSRVEQVKISRRLAHSPVAICAPQSAMIRRLLKVSELASESIAMGKQTLEINPTHPLIIDLYRVSHTDTDLARLIAEQLLDNAMIAADLLDNPRAMLPRLYELLQRVMPH